MTETDPSTRPSVLVVVVVRDGAAWLRDCLESLSSQTHPRVGVLAVDNASADGSDELLEQALGPGRVLRLGQREGVAASVRAALQTPAAAEADYLLIVHDDTALAPDAVERLVDAAEGIAGLDNVGVVGAKVVDWDDPRILREVGRTTDRFGHAYTPLQDGEMDQGQYDRVLEVLFVSSCVMLVSRAAWQRTGPPDERLDHREDLDFCWRARLAGFRVLMTPLAQARHRDATERGERVEEHRLRGPRYYAERAATAAMLKNYGIRSLLWLLPLYGAVGIGRVVLLAATRRFEDTLELLAAWGWNLLHLPGTILRRVRAQSVRSIPDRGIRPFMESAGLRIPRWLETAGRIIEEQRGIDEDEEIHLGRHASSLAYGHPVLVAWILAMFVGLVAHRRFLGPELLEGGALPALPATAEAFFRELFSAIRSTGLGGDLPASPALAVLGGLSWLFVGSTALAMKVLLIALPGVAGVSMYRAVVRQTGHRPGAVVAAAALSLSAVMLWSFSEGRVGLLVALAAVPAVGERLEAAFARERPERTLRLVAGAGAALGLAVSFFPGIVPAFGLLLLVQVLFGRARARGLAIGLGMAVVAGVLVFPSVPAFLLDPAGAFSSGIGTADFGDVVGQILGPSPGSWIVAWFLPIAALLGFLVAGERDRGRANRALAAALFGTFLSWGAGAGYLPAPVSNAPVYAVVAAVAEATLVGLGVVSVLAGLGREAFGLRQIGAGGLSAVLAVGLVAQSLAAMTGGWSMGPGNVPDAWPVVASAASEDARVLWLGGDTGDRFPAPGGDPQGLVEAGDDSVRYALTGVDGASALDVGRWRDGAGYAYAERALTEILAGGTVHGGAMLAPLATEFLVAGEGDLPARVRRALDAQVDLDLVPAEGLLIYHNPRALPVASVFPGKPYGEAALRGDLLAVASAIPGRPARLRRVGDGWTGSAEDTGLAVMSLEFDPSLGPEKGLGPGQEAFGWATALEVRAAGTVTLARRDPGRGVQMMVLAVLWLAALWLTRRPASS
ncbi:MAG TPA: glycosyltransferase family 2 protein [Actinomycetota bacterium]|nr:glycosyltransferase family 2 protein [Actinomycetota bacterium]